MFDVIILGAGPAGSEALFRLAKAGIRTVLIEKRSKGQGKPCGGAIFPREIELFGDLPFDVYDYPITKAIIKTDCAEDLVHRIEAYDVPSGYNVKREIYDTYLMERAQEAGGEIRFKERVIHIDKEHDHTTIETNKSTYRARFVFVALGWRGLSLFDKIGLQKYPYKKSGVAVQKILEGEYFDDPNTVCFYYLPELEGGYFWVFPKKGVTYVGCGKKRENKCGNQLMSILDAFVTQQFVNPKILHKEGGLVPCFAASTFCQNGVFLLGDSAGLANPLHGGGILEARLSAKLAARAIMEFYAGSLEDPCSYYCRSIKKEIIDHTHRWDAIIAPMLHSSIQRKKLWNLSLLDSQLRFSLSIIFSPDIDHFKSYRIILERVFKKLQQEMEETFQPYQRRINGVLDSLFQNDTPLNDVINYTLLSPGKRLRASLVCAMSEALGAEVEKAIPAAISYELAHTASLVHDDIIDKAILRRGKESVVKRYGVEGAIVSGDGLLIKSFEYLVKGHRGDDLSKEDLVDLVECGTCSGIKACQGELLDVKIGKEPEKYSVGDYIRLVEQKTAALIEGPCQAAAIIAGRKEMRSTVALFGRYIGIAFQILDDAKDIFASEESSLKGRFADIRNRKPNLYIISMLRRANKEDRVRLENMLEKGDLCEEDIQFIFRACDDTGVFYSVKKLFGSYLRRADNLLNRLADSDAKARLRKLIDAMAYWKDL